jgi:hypothetical protein
MHAHKLPVLVLAWLCLVPLPAAAGGESSQVVGRVVDQSGAALPGVTVILQRGCRCRDCKDPEKCDCCVDARTVQVSGADGEFSFMVEPGTYSLLAELEGFSVVEVDEVVVAPGTATRLTVTMSTRVDVLVHRERDGWLGS